MLKDNWLERQIETVKELIETGMANVKENKLVQAEKSLREAEVILDSAEVIDARVINLRATVFNELGVIAHQTKDPVTATKYHRKAVATLLELESDDRGHKIRLAASRLNTGGLLASQGQFEEAEEQNRAAIELLKSAGDDSGAELMSLGAYQNLGVILLNTDRPEEGLEALASATEVADRLIASGESALRLTLVQILLNSSVAQHRVGHHAGAIELGTRSSDLALALHKESHDDGILSLFLSSQMNLVTFNEAAARFADAEDALFKVLDVVPGHPEVIARGRTFYEDILKKTDEELEAGGLPRDEAEESMAELGDAQ